MGAFAQQDRSWQLKSSQLTNVKQNGVFYPRPLPCEMLQCDSIQVLRQNVRVLNSFCLLTVRSPEPFLYLASLWTRSLRRFNKDVHENLNIKSWKAWSTWSSERPLWVYTTALAVILILGSSTCSSNRKCVWCRIPDFHYSLRGKVLPDLPYECLNSIQLFSP